jgi:hypothetical protein
MKEYTPVASSYGISEGNRLIWDQKEGLAFRNSFIQQRLKVTERQKQV